MAVTAALWQRSALPGGFGRVLREELRTLPQLAELRSRVRIEATGTPEVREPEREHWSERLVLVVDELASNALRHGLAPVDAELSRDGDEWMIAVSDSSGGHPPMPAQGRDPARGGFGLYLVADLSSRHGWCSSDGAKTVWAVVHATVEPG